MPHLQRIWLGMRTRHGYPDAPHAGSNSPIALVINQNGLDVVNATFPPTKQADQEAGQANLYVHEFSAPTFDPTQLGPASIRLGISGHDLWQPEHVVVWYEPLSGPIVPLAAELDTQVGLSTDSGEGVPSTPVRQVATGTPATPIERLLLMMTTGRAGVPSMTTTQSDTFLDLRPGPGTDSTIQLQIVRQGSLILQYDVPDTPQRDQEKNQANLYLFPAPSPFTRGSLEQDAVMLSIKGKDAWLPTSLILFGVTPKRGRPTHLVPLVHISNWQLGWLTTETQLGNESVYLPLT